MGDPCQRGKVVIWSDRTHGIRMCVAVVEMLSKRNVKADGQHTVIKESLNAGNGLDLSMGLSSTGLEPQQSKLGQHHDAELLIKGFRLFGGGVV